MFHGPALSATPIAAQLFKSLSTIASCIREGYALWREACGSIWT